MVRLDNGQEEVLRVLLSSVLDGANSRTISDTAGILWNQLYEDRPGQDDSIDLTATRPIVEQILDIIQENGARNVLSGETLTLLRNGLLVPSEREAVQSRLANRLIACLSCGHGFNLGELAITQGLRDGERLGFVCTNCAMPAVAACKHRGCNAFYRLPDAIMRMLNKNKEGHFCSTHQKKSGEEAVQIPTEDGDAVGPPNLEPGVSRWLNQTMRNARAMPVSAPTGITFSGDFDDDPS